MMSNKSGLGEIVSRSTSSNFTNTRTHISPARVRRSSPPHHHSRGDMYASHPLHTEVQQRRPSPAVMRESHQQLHNAEKISQVTRLGEQYIPQEPPQTAQLRQGTHVLFQGERIESELETNRRLDPELHYNPRTLLQEQFQEDSPQCSSADYIDVLPATRGVRLREGQGLQKGNDPALRLQSSRLVYHDPEPGSIWKPQHIRAQGQSSLLSYPNTHSYSLDDIVGKDETVRRFQSDRIAVAAWDDPPKASLQQGSRDLRSRGMAQQQNPCQHDSQHSHGSEEPHHSLHLQHHHTLSTDTASRALRQQSTKFRDATYSSNFQYEQQPQRELRGMHEQFESQAESGPVHDNGFSVATTVARIDSGHEKTNKLSDFFSQLSAFGQHERHVALEPRSSTAPTANPRSSAAPQSTDASQGADWAARNRTNYEPEALAASQSIPALDASQSIPPPPRETSAKQISKQQREKLKVELRTSLLVMKKADREILLRTVFLVLGIGRSLRSQSLLVGAMRSVGLVGICALTGNSDEGMMDGNAGNAGFEIFEVPTEVVGAEEEVVPAAAERTITMTLESLLQLCKASGLTGDQQEIGGCLILVYDAFMDGFCTNELMAT